MSEPGDLHAVPAARAVGWFATSAALRAAARVDLGPGWFAVLDPALPGSYEHNRLVVAAAVPARTLVAAADTVLGGAGLPHRQVDVLGALPHADIAALEAAGYVHAAQEILAHPLTAEDAAGPPDPRVEEAAEDAVAPVVERMWRAEDLPGGIDAVIDDLLRRRRLLDRAGEVQRLVVRRPGSAPGTAGGEIVARADLVAREAAAEIDAVWTDPVARGQGFGDALLAEGIRRAAAGGADLLLLVAAAHDWPRSWYARHGFAEVAPLHGFTRWPA